VDDGMLRTVDLNQQVQVLGLVPIVVLEIESEVNRDRSLSAGGLETAREIPG
jgi:hypothetical protein